VHESLGRENRALGKPKLFFSAPEIFVFLGAPLDFELAENGVPANVDFVLLGFEAAQRAFAQFTQIAERRRIADEGVDFLARGRLDFDGGENQFQFLHDDAFDFEEMVVVRRAEFFRA
jgi:hypothetical protein